MFAFAGDDGGEEGHGRGAGGEGAEEGRDHPGGRRRVHHDGEAHPRAVRQTPVSHGAALVLSEQGALRVREAVGRGGEQ